MVGTRTVQNAEFRVERAVRSASATPPPPPPSPLSPWRRELLSNTSVTRRNAPRQYFYRVVANPVQFLTGATCVMEAMAPGPALPGSDEHTSRAGRRAEPTPGVRASSDEGAYNSTPLMVTEVTPPSPARKTAVTAAAAISAAAAAATAAADACYIR